MKELKITKRDGQEVEFDLDNSKSTSAVGIHLNKIRPDGAGIYGTLKGNPLSWFDTMLCIDKPWVVAYKFPYDVINSNAKDNPNSLTWEEDKFERRLDAEKASLEKQIEYIKTSKEFYDMDKELVFGMIRQLEYQLENIEEEHPEWII